MSSRPPNPTSIFGERWHAPDSWSAPGRDAVDVWRVRLDREPAGGSALLDVDERRRAARLLFADRRRQFVAGRSALRAILGRYLACDPARVELRVGPNGRPELPLSMLSFNLSHSGDLALLAVAPGELPLGIDVEETLATRPLDRLALRFFSAAEHESYVARPDCERPASFYRLWTRKEAYLKAWGTGLTFSSRRFTVALEPGPGRHLLGTEMPGDREPAAWWFEDLDPGPGFGSSLCFRGEPRPIRLFAWN